MDQKRIGAFIAQLRKEKAWTQAQLGEKMGVTNKTISRWENGNYLPDLSLLQSLCTLLEVNVNELLCGQRLAGDDFRQKADHMLVSSLTREKTLLKRKRIRDFFNGAGTGLLISVVYSPDNLRRLIIFIVSILMLCLGYYFQKQLDRAFFDEED